MDNEDFSLEEKCEHLMNIVVESRKRYGKMCIEYEQKTSLIENNILHLQIKTITNSHFKSKHSVPDIKLEEMSQDIKEFTAEIIEKTKRIENLKNKLRNTQQVVLQQKKDDVGRRLREPLTTEAMLTKVRNKK